MKLFKNFVLCVVTLAFFFSQVLGVNAHSLKNESQDSHFISMTENENRVSRVIDLIKSYISEQGSENNVKKVAGLMGAEAAIFGLVAYLVYFFTRPKNPALKPAEKVGDAALKSAWALT